MYDTVEYVYRWVDVDGHVGDVSYDEEGWVLREEYLGGDGINLSLKGR